MKSNKQIKKLGKEIRNQKTNLNKETLKSLQEYRISHKAALSYVFNEIISIKKMLKKKSILTFRIKRIETILDKFINREKDVHLHQMWDIGGCRIICRNYDEVNRYKNEIKKLFKVRRYRDYIKTPKESGYKSIHIYVESIDNRVIEIQIRNQLDHNWSTLVEITDLLYDTKIKEHNQKNELFRMHYLLSKNEQIINTKDKKIILNIISKFKYIDKLSSVFNRNYLSIRKQWLLIESDSSFKFFLIQTSKSKTPIISAFSNYELAENEYFNKFSTENNDVNIVLTHLITPSFEQINTAYSNYLLTMHNSISKFIKMSETVTIESLRLNKYRDFIKYLSIYNEISLTRFHNYYQESKIEISFPKDSSKKIKKKFDKKVFEWKNQFLRNLRSSQKQADKFKTEFNNNLPKDSYKRTIIKYILKYINWKQKRKLNKLYKKIS